MFENLKTSLWNIFNNGSPQRPTAPGVSGKLPKDRQAPITFEIVSGSGEALSLAIDKGLQNGTLSPVSMALLKTLPCEVVKDLEGTVKSIDWNGLTSVRGDKVEVAFKLLKQVSQIEGVDNDFKIAEVASKTALDVAARKDVETGDNNGMKKTDTAKTTPAPPAFKL